MRRIRGFDGLRAVAALLVFCEHKVFNHQIGAIGVWVFFCLSGYLIVGILHRDRVAIEDGSARVGLGHALAAFWRNRALRILPIYYATVIGVSAVARSFTTDQLLWYLFYVQNFYIGLVSHEWGLMTHFWSLAIEQQFYVLSAPVLLWLASARHKPLMAVIFWACVAFIAVAALAHMDVMLVSLLPMSTFAFIALGGYLVLIDERSAIRRWLGHGFTAIAGAGSFAAAFVREWLVPTTPDGIPFHFYFLGLFFAGSLLCFTLNHQQGALVGLLETKPMRWLGQVSYGFYVYHALLPGREHVSRVSHVPIDAYVGYYTWALLQLAASLAVAHLSWICFEKRFLSLKRATT